MAAEIFTKSKGEDRKVLTVYESKKALAQEDFPVNKFELARSKEEAFEIAQRLGFPLVAKIVSAQIVHKTDIGGIVVGIRDQDELADAYDRVTAAAQEKAEKAPSEIEALDIGIQAEKDSILFYVEMQNLVSPPARKVVSGIIDEEKGHLRQLSELKQAVQES